MKITVHCLAPGHQGGWSLKNLYHNKAERHDPAFARRLSLALQDRIGTSAYAPAVAEHSAVIADPRDLNLRVELPGYINIFRNQSMPADGVLLHNGEAFIMSGAGCMVLVAVAGDLCVAAHASRDSLIDRKFLLTGVPSRRHASVVDAMFDLLKKRASSGIRMRGYFGVRGQDLGHPFNDPKHGAYNRALAKHVRNEYGGDCLDVIGGETSGTAYLDMSMLVAHQAMKHGIADVECSDALPTNGPFANTRHDYKEMRTERNLCIAYRERMKN